MLEPRLYSADIWHMPLRVDNDAKFIRTFWGRYAVQKGKRVYPQRWKRKVHEAMRESQRDTPTSLLTNGKRTLWYFHDCFYWDDDALGAEDVKALILQRERRLQQKLQTARSLMRAEEAGRPSRIPIPSELRRAVFERDGGRCVECNSNFDLQYDHVLPVAHGGATTLENLQLLCADCNRRKSDLL